MTEPPTEPPPEPLTATLVTTLVEVHDHHPDAIDCVEAYYAELDERFPAGFDGGDWLNETVDDRCLPPRGTFVVAYTGEHPVGCGGLRTIAADVGEIKRMWVAPDGRGRGLSRRMLTLLEDRARILGHHTTKLDTNDVLDAAIRLYETHGYEPIERYNDNPYARLFFQKRLDPKRSWRAQLRSTDRLPDPTRLAAVNAGIAGFLADHGCARVLAFRATDHEPSLDRLIDADPSRFALTRTHDDGTLTVHPADGPDEQHRFGFRQPVADAPELDIGAIDAVLVPGLGFDARGRRLGHGAGYYDRLLPGVAADVPIIGVAPDGWLVDELPSEPHDVAMTHLADENGVRPVAADPDADARAES